MREPYFKVDLFLKMMERVLQDKTGAEILFFIFYSKEAWQCSSLYIVDLVEGAAAYRSV